MVDLRDPDEVLPGFGGGSDSAAEVTELSFALAASAVQFEPTYYPDTIRRVGDKKLQEEKSPRGGEEVTIDKIHNAHYHITGVVTSDEIDQLKRLHHDCRPAQLTCHMTNNLSTIVKKVEIAERDGWDPESESWLWNYTLDLVSTGIDEFGGDQNSDINDWLYST